LWGVLGEDREDGKARRFFIGQLDAQIQGENGHTEAIPLSLLPRSSASNAMRTLTNSNGFSNGRTEANGIGDKDFRGGRVSERIQTSFTRREATMNDGPPKMV
jgi:hypothetical protein